MKEIEAAGQKEIGRLLDMGVIRDPTATEQDVEQGEIGGFVMASGRG